MTWSNIKLAAEVIKLVVDAACAVVDRRRNSKVAELEREIAELKRRMEASR